MCGIAGILDRRGADVAPGRLEIMAEAVRHRGPDGEGFQFLGPAALAHRRLKIVDLTDASAQPLSILDGDLWITYNGEIHNYPELRQELEGLGAQFRTTGDTEVVLWAWKIWGPDCFERFNGMWAIAIWDSRKQSLVLSRDRFGIKPLYYYIDEKRALFASEIKSILAAYPELRIPNENYIMGFLNGSPPHSTPDTFIRNIRSVKGGTWMEITRDKVSENSYWSFQPGEENTYSNAPEKFRELLEDAVRLRLRSDAPLAASLSGGLDSSAVVRLAGPMQSGMKCFSLRAHVPKIDESHYAAMAADDKDLYQLEWIDTRELDFAEVVTSLCWHHDCPPVMRGVVSQWLVSERVRQDGVKVLVNGNGSDEFLAGYDMFALPYLLDRVRFRNQHPRPFSWQTLLAEARDLAGVYAGVTPLEMYVKRNLKSLLKRHRDPAVQFATRKLRQQDVSDPRLYRNNWLHPAGDRPFRSHLNNALWQEFRYAGLGEALHSEDVITMAFSIESRLPFLDHRLIEFCFSLPYHEKIRDGWTKSILRRSSENLLPEEIRWRRPKLGFAGPNAQWMARPNSQAFIKDVLGTQRCRERGVLDPTKISKITAMSEADFKGLLWSGRVNTIWKLLVTELACQQFIDGQGFEQRFSAPRDQLPGADNKGHVAALSPAVA